MNCSLSPIRFASVAALALLLTACSSGPSFKKPRERTNFDVAFRQGAPQPVYSRTRWVHPPEVLPARGVSRVASDAPRVNPVFQLALTNATIEEAATVLAQSAKYSSFCPEYAKTRRVTINASGTLEQLTEELSKITTLSFVVDHRSREIRVESGAARRGPIAPRIDPSAEVPSRDGMGLSDMEDALSGGT